VDTFHRGRVDADVVANQGIQPPADALNTSVDYLIKGTSQEKAKASLKNTLLLKN